MSDEEESMSEGFSASEEEWTPNTKTGGGGGGGESSDDDDSDFEDIRKNSSSTAATNVTKKRVEVKSRIVQKSTKKRKTVGQTLRAKLYNKYRPPPKTFSPPGTSPSTSKKAPGVPKNSKTPNESNVRREDDSSSECSINNYLVNPDELDLSSSFFNKPSNEDKDKSHSPSTPPPIFDCNVGLENQTDSDSEAEPEAEENGKKFDFDNLLQNLNNIERTKEEMAKRNVEWTTSTSKTSKKVDAMDVYSVLALGEKQQNHSKKEYDEDEDDEEEEEEDENDGKATRSKYTSRSTKLNKSKSTRIKRHVKVRPTSMSVPSDSDDSEWEDVADQQNDSAGDVKSSTNNLEIVVALPTRQHCTKTKTQQDMELALKRKFNRDRKEHQLLMHKVSLLCLFGHYYQYNRVLNSMKLMKLAVKLLPSQSAYPTQKGTEVKYYQSLAIWFKTAINLKSTDFTSAQKHSNKKQVKLGLREQIKAKEACCKQDMIYIFVILLRGMGFQCRLVVNMQPIPLKPPTDDLISIKLKTNTDNAKKSNPTKVVKVTENVKFTPKKIITKMKRKGAEDIKNNAQNATESVKAGNIHKTNKTTTKTENSVIKRRQDTKKNESKNQLEKKDTQLSKKSAIRTRSQSTETKPQEVNASEKNKKSTKTQLESVEEEPKLGHGSEKDKISKTTTKTTKAPAEKLVNLEKLKTNRKVDGATTSLSNTASKRAHLPDISQEPKSKAKPKEFTKKSNTTVKANNHLTASTRSRSKSPTDQVTINPEFLQSERLKTKLDSVQPPNKAKLKTSQPKKSKEKKVQISATFLTETHRILRSRVLETNTIELTKTIPQLDGEDDEIVANLKEKKRPNLNKLKNQRNKFNEHESDEDFEPSQSKRPKSAPIVTRNNRLALSPDIENDKANASLERKRKSPVHDVWVEVWCDVEQKWICIDLFSGKVDCVESIKKSASGSMAYVYAFQNDLCIKDVTARYCSKWADTVRKCRVDKDWLDTALNSYMARPTMRDIQEDQELRRIHEEKPMPTAISDYKNHPFYALERHLLKFEALYPPNAPTLGYVRGEPVYSRDCVHTLHSRELWLKQARVVKLGEKPYKIVKARPKWDRITQTVIKDQPLEIFGFWQTQDYEPPTAENGLVPRNAYGNVELFKPTMLPKKTVHLRLPGLNRICKKLGIDCANAVVGFDFHQGACHPTYDGFVVCEEFGDQVTAAWHQDQEDQERKELEKYEARVYGNWKKLIRGLFIRERIKAKYNL